MPSFLRFVVLIVLAGSACAKFTNTTLVKLTDPYSISDYSVVYNNQIYVLQGYVNSPVIGQASIIVFSMSGKITANIPLPMKCTTANYCHVQVDSFVKEGSILTVVGGPYGGAGTNPVTFATVDLDSQKVTQYVVVNDTSIINGDLVPWNATHAIAILFYYSQGHFGHTWSLLNLATLQLIGNTTAAPNVSRIYISASFSTQSSLYACESRDDSDGRPMFTQYAVPTSQDGQFKELYRTNTPCFFVQYSAPRSSLAIVNYDRDHEVISISSSTVTSSGISPPSAPVNITSKAYTSYLATSANYAFIGDRLWSDQSKSQVFQFDLNKKAVLDKFELSESYILFDFVTTISQQVQVDESAGVFAAIALPPWSNLPYALLIALFDKN